MAVAANVEQRRRHGPDEGLAAVLHALAVLAPGGSGAPVGCTWMCRAVVAEVRARNAGPAGPLDDTGRDAEFEAVLVRRLAQRYLRVVADHAAGASVPGVWQLLLDPPPASPAGRALAGATALRDHDLTLAFVGAATVLGRAPGVRECHAHQRVAALLGRCTRELVGLTGNLADVAAAARFDDPAGRRASWQRAEHLWTLRGRPAEAENARRVLDQEAREAGARLLSVP